MKLIVKMRLFKGKETYDKNGKINSENQEYKLEYGGLEWSERLKGLKNLCTRAEVIGVQEEHTELKHKEHAGKQHPYLEYSYKDVDDISKYVKEVEAAFSEPKPELTADQKRIADLEAKLEAVLNAGNKEQKPKEVKEEVKSEVDEEFEARKLEATRNEYLEVIGKKPHHKASIENMTEAIKNAKA